MPLYDTNDLDDATIRAYIDHVNQMFGKIISMAYNAVSPETQARIRGLVKPCCSEDDLKILTHALRVYLENCPTIDGMRLPVEFATAAILYYYYQLVLIETNISTFLDLRMLKYLKITPEEIAFITMLANHLITSNSDYVVEIRKSFLQFNKEPFYGGKRKSKRKYAKKHTRKSKRKTHQTYKRHSK